MHAIATMGNTQRRRGHRLQKAAGSEFCNALVRQAFGQAHSLNNRRSLAMITAQHAFNERFRTHTANLHRPTTEECSGILPATLNSEQVFKPG